MRPAPPACCHGEQSVTTCARSAWRCSFAGARPASGGRPSVGRGRPHHRRRLAAAAPAQGRPVLAVDVRAPEAFQAGRLPGARSIPLTALTARQGELPPDGSSSSTAPTAWMKRRPRSYLRSTEKNVFVLRAALPHGAPAGTGSNAHPRSGDGNGSKVALRAPEVSSWTSGMSTVDPESTAARRRADVVVALAPGRRHADRLLARARQRVARLRRRPQLPEEPVLPRARLAQLRWMLTGASWATGSR